ncbi:MAG: PTS sugar transporter subunit IIA [Luteolibacter sp.]
MPISLLTPDTPLVLDLDAVTEEAAILELAGHLKGHPDIRDLGAFTVAVLERQKINPPLLGSGIALPHARTGEVREVVFAVARTRGPVPFGEGKCPVRLIFLYGIPPHRVAEHLATTAALARKLRDPKVVTALLDAPDEETFRKVLN